MVKPVSNNLTGISAVNVGLVTCMRAVVNLEILKARKTLVADQASVRLLVGVGADVNQHLVPTIYRNVRLTYMLNTEKIM